MHVDIIKIMNELFLPTTAKELKRRGIEVPDFIIVSADAYVDHPSFAAALLGRHLESRGYSVGIIAQPSPADSGSYSRMGKPRFAFLVSGGNMDSMVNHYTANKAPRKEDAYSPGGVRVRPDRATIVYTKMLKSIFPDVPVVIGGVEASLRRFAHYDYWEDTVRPSILEDCPADMLVYGMGERPLLELAEGLEAGLTIEQLTYIRGTAHMSAQRVEGVSIPSFESVKKDKRKFAEAFVAQYKEQDFINGRIVIQPHKNYFLVQNPPAEPLLEEELDTLYSLPFTRTAHPSYKKAIPALEEVRFSVTFSRGCFGGCAFCSIYFHQGRYVRSRSVESVGQEVERITHMPDFKGYIHDVGGPTANFSIPSCAKAEKVGMCPEKRCLAPNICKNINPDHSKYICALKRARETKGVKRVFIRSGVRYDYALLDNEFMMELAAYHVSGELKVAPEHCSSEVLALMGKGSIKDFERFCSRFAEHSKRAGKKQYVLPYFICSHPGSTLNHAIELALYLKKRGFIPDQVQDFYPTPGSVSTCMYYTGLDPFTMQPIYVPRSREERSMQRALLQFNKSENRSLVRQALVKAGRPDLIGKNGLIQ